MILKKTGICIDCGLNSLEKSLITGRCQYHYKIHRFNVLKDRKKSRSEEKKVEIYERKVYYGSKKTGDSERKVEVVNMKEWFLQRGMELTGICEACGNPSCKGDPKYEWFSIAHIFPKATFKSVALHPLNFIELCFWSPSCHSNYDNLGIDFAVKMKCWPEMVRRFKEFEHLLTAQERSTKFYALFIRGAENVSCEKIIK